MVYDSVRNAWAGEIKLHKTQNFISKHQFMIYLCLISINFQLIPGPNPSRPSLPLTPRRLPLGKDPGGTI